MRAAATISESFTIPAGPSNFRHDPIIGCRIMASAYAPIRTHRPVALSHKAARLGAAISV